MAGGRPRALIEEGDILEIREDGEWRARDEFEVGVVYLEPFEEQDACCCTLLQQLATVCFGPNLRDLCGIGRVN